jgi:hypothetical protein
MRRRFVSAHAPMIYGSDPIQLDGRWGCRYWVQHPFVFTSNATVDERLSGYPVAVFQPDGRPAHETPLVVGLQGMAAPYQWNAFLVPTLLDMGIACALFDLPLAGERSLARNYRSDVVSEVEALLECEARLGGEFVARAAEAVSRNVGTVLRLAQERHGLRDDRLALFGVSLGALLSAFVFMRDGVGQRLLGAIGHADLPRFARSYAPALTPWLCRLPLRTLGRLLARLTGRNAIRAGADFLLILHELCSGAGDADPMRYAGRVSAARRIRFLVGADDPLVNPADAVACARRFPDGECYIVPGLAHGGGAFVDHVRYFLGTQLGDWRP